MGLWGITPIKRIWKYRVALDPGRATINAPLGAELLSVQENWGDLACWCLVDPEQPEQRRIELNIVYTGEPFTPLPKSKFLGTVQHQGLVYHVFQE